MESLSMFIFLGRKMKIGDKVTILKDIPKMGLKKDHVVLISSIFDNSIYVKNKDNIVSQFYKTDRDVLFKLDDSLGDRYNQGKLKWSSFPKFLIRPLIEVAHFGETKYDKFNFLDGQKVLTCMDSMDRHLDKFMDPNLPDIDDESKCHHLAHVAWNALVALYMLTSRSDMDDRYKGEQNESSN